MDSINIRLTYFYFYYYILMLVVFICQSCGSNDLRCPRVFPTSSRQVEIAIDGVSMVCGIWCKD